MLGFSPLASAPLGDDGLVVGGGNTVDLGAAHPRFVVEPDRLSAFAGL
jgi:hypothetical protein